MAENRQNATSEQIEKLISLVESNKQIVTSRSLGTAKYWNAVANELNALGPPIHNRNEWKEIWYDYCDTLKDQLVDNYVKNKDAGKYPWDLTNFTPLEKRVIDMMCMVKSLQPIPNTRALGLPHMSPVKFVSNEPQSSQPPVPPEPQPQPEMDTTVGCVRNRRHRYRSLAVLQLLELRKLTKVNRKLCLLKQKELKVKNKQLLLMKQRLKMDIEIVQKRLEWDREMAGV
uniref:Regulatory protein zeste n=1 Tax=Anopheles coluzzii TaxID=1518534 RepID=A0A6E8W9S9_ANOCL